jgi:hypothetical protein
MNIVFSIGVFNHFICKNDFCVVVTKEQKNVLNAENAITFVPENETKRSAVIPHEKLEEVFDPDDLEISPDEDEKELDLEAGEETEGLQQVEGLAEGMDFEDLHEVAKVVEEQPKTVSRETGAKMVELEHTDMFEALASGNEGKMNWIKSVIDRHVQDTIPETVPETELKPESKISDAEYGNFDIADFLGKSFKK